MTIAQIIDALNEARKLAEGYSKAHQQEREETRRLREMAQNLKTRVGQLESTVERYKAFLPKQEAEIEQLRKTIKALELELLERPQEPGKEPEPMKIVKGSIFSDKPVTDQVVEGEKYVRRLAIYENAGAPGSVVRGEPVFFTSAPSLIAVGRVTGTDAALAMTANVTKLGSATEPAEVEIIAPSVQIRLALANNALREFRWDLLDQANEDVLATGIVEVIPSAFGAVR